MLPVTVNTRALHGFPLRPWGRSTTSARTISDFGHPRNATIERLPEFPRLSPRMASRRQRDAARMAWQPNGRSAFPTIREIRRQLPDFGKARRNRHLVARLEIWAKVGDA
jgi:hypothetical protein